MKRKTKTILIISSIVVLCIILVVAYLFFKAKTKSTQATNQQTAQQEANPAKSDSNKNSRQPDSPSTSSSSGKASVTLTTADVSDGNVYVSALVNGATSGNCTVTFTKQGANSIKKTAPIGLQVSYYICRGFIVPASEFTQKGDWNVTVNVTTPNGDATSETKQVSVK